MTSRYYWADTDLKALAIMAARSFHFRSLSSWNNEWEITPHEDLGHFNIAWSCLLACLNYLIGWIPFGSCKQVRDDDSLNDLLFFGTKLYCFQTKLGGWPRRFHFNYQKLFVYFRDSVTRDNGLICFNSIWERLILDVPKERFSVFQVKTERSGACPPAPEEQSKHRWAPFLLSCSGPLVLIRRGLCLDGP